MGSEWGLWQFGRAQFENWASQVCLFHGFCRLFGVDKHGNLQTPSESSKIACCFKHVFFTDVFFLPREKCTLQQFIFVSFGPFIFRLCFPPLAQKNTSEPGVPFWDFREAEMGSTGPMSGSGKAHFGNVGVVCFCGAVCLCGECHGVVNDVFCGVSLSGTMRSAMSVPLKYKPPLPPLACGPLQHRSFSNVQRLPVRVL